LDNDTVSGIRDSLTGYVENCGQARVIVDLGNVEYVSSLFLGLMVRLHKKLAAGGRELEIRNLRPSVYEVFAISSLDRFLNLFSVPSGPNLSLDNCVNPIRVGFPTKTDRM
jgi:anti-anti-sigma factor